MNSKEITVYLLNVVIFLCVTAMMVCILKDLYEERKNKNKSIIKIKKHNKNKDNCLVEELRNENKKILDRISDISAYNTRVTVNHFVLGGGLDENLKRGEEERRCKIEALERVVSCIDEVLYYLKNPDNYVSEKQILMLQRKLSEKKRGGCNER